MALTDYTAAELASLAPEERAALEAADGGNKDALEELAAGGEEAGEGGDAAAAAAAAAAPAAQTEGDPAAAPAAAAPAADGKDPKDGKDSKEAAAPAADPKAAAPAAGPTPAPAPNVTVYRAEVGDLAKEVAAEKDVIKTARAEKRAALMKLNDGEIDAEEYGKIEDAADAKIDAANDKLLELNRAHTRAEVAAELTQQQQGTAWKGMLNVYMADAKKDLGIDYQADETKRGEFNSLLKAFATEAADKGMSDDTNMAASRWALDQAAAVMAFRYPKAGAAPAAAGTPAAAPTGAPAATPAPAAAAARAQIPPSLGSMPSAATAPVADDVMAKIGALEGDELEQYMASLPKDVFARVTSGAQ